MYAAVDYPPCEQGSAPGRLLLQDFYGRTLDSAACRSFVTTLTHEGERFSMGMNWLSFAYAGQTLALVYYETGRVEFYDLSHGKLSLEKAAGDSTPVEELMEVDLTQRSFQGVKYDAIVSDGKYFYVLANDYRCHRSPTRPVEHPLHLLRPGVFPSGDPTQEIHTRPSGQRHPDLSGCHLRLQPVERLRAGVRLPPG